MRAKRAGVHELSIQPEITLFDNFQFECEKSKFYYFAFGDRIFWSKLGHSYDNISINEGRV